MVLDDILWEAFIPNTDLGGARARRNLKIKGAFIVDPLRINEGVISVARPDDLDATVGLVIDQFVTATAQFTDRYPTVADYATALEQQIPENQRSWPRNRLRQIVTLIAADRREEAVDLADSEIARGETGPYTGSILGSGHSDGVFQHLSLHCKPAQASTAYLASRKPSHRFRILAETDGYRRDGELAHGFARHRDALQLLRDFTGTSLWGMILSPLPDTENLQYLQAVGRADAMTLEICAPSGPPASESTRSVIGHRAASPSVERVIIELPHSTEVISGDEVFAAEEAIEVFQTYYDTGTISSGYTLRPVEVHPNSG
ncbi:hypothetical protein [Mycobacterium camsae]|uniref:hypothetical protein n=1 Tax=Mycobacterium gordonae TaxID=1778 RepID=UPI00198071F0|nr:hypothetical protein [Mycobacterium gordonae]